MSIPNRQIGWSTESNLLWQVAKQIQRLSGIIANSVVPGLQDLQASDYADDAAAQAGGIPVGGLYHTAGIVKIRLV